MGIISGMFEKRSQLTNPEPWLLKALGYMPTYSGVTVTEETAVRMTAVFSCIRLLSWTLAFLPLPVYERVEPKGKTRAPRHPNYRLVHDRPNPEQTAFSWKALKMAHLCLYGNAYSEIEFDRNGRPVALWPIPPWRVQVKRTENMEKVYELSLPNGKQKILRPFQIIHILGLSTDGMKGLSPIAAARQAIGLGLAAEEFGARFFGEGANVGGVAEHPGKLSEAGSTNLRNQLNEKYAGLGKSHRIMLLEEGMKYQRVGIPPNDAQFLDTQKFQVSQIARLYNVPLHMLQEHEKSTSWGTGLEEMVLGFIKFTMSPWFVNWEQELNWKLFDEREQDKHFVEFVVEGLLRGDSKARAEFYNRIFQVGGFSVNDILEKENMNPIGPEGDEHFVPMNMVPLKAAVDETPDERAYRLRAAAEIERGQAAEPPPHREAHNIEKRSAATRHRIAKTYKRIFEDAGKRIVKRESEAIMSKAKELLGSRNKDSFLGWLEEFYQKHPDYVKRQILPPVTALAEAIQAEVSAEVDVEAGMTPELEKFTEEYAEAFTARHISSSQGQLEQVVNTAYDAGEDELEAVGTRLDEWNERRPEKIANRETVQINGAVTRFAMAAAGVTKLVWRAAGSKTCEFCQSLDGTVVGIEQPFIPANSSVSGKDSAGNQLTVYGPKMHPPIHEF